jgi:hypothetical protein
MGSWEVSVGTKKSYRPDQKHGHLHVAADEVLAQEAKYRGEGTEVVILSNVESEGIFAHGESATGQIGKS